MGHEMGLTSVLGDYSDCCFPGVTVCFLSSRVEGSSH